MGSCVDNSRIFKMITEISKVMNVPVSHLPIAGAAMEWMSEKAISIGAYFIILGVMIVLGIVPPILSSENVTKYLCKDMENITGGKLVFQNDPVMAGVVILEHINKKRKLLGI
jgi:carbon-monoxide dehydrogenase catalytic subunit